MIGFMQGRLSPVVNGKIQAFPWDFWKDEFSIANENDFLLMDDFARAIDTDREPILNAQNGRDIAATVFASLESSKTGIPVEVCY